MQKHSNNHTETARQTVLWILDAMTFKRVVLVLVALVFVPVLSGMAGWSIPIFLTLLSSGAADSLAASFLELLAYAGLIYGVVYVARALLRSGGHRGP
jgi:hypothetical protein